TPRATRAPRSAHATILSPRARGCRAWPGRRCGTRCSSPCTSGDRVRRPRSWRWTAASSPRARTARKVRPIAYFPYDKVAFHPRQTGDAMQLELLTIDGVAFVLRWIHFMAGITWIGLLYYFNFVQVPFFAETEAPVRTGAIVKLVPRALWWFRW